MAAPILQPPKDVASPVLLQVPISKTTARILQQTSKDTDSIESKKGIMSKQQKIFLKGIYRKRAQRELPMLLPPVKVVEEPEHEPWEPRQNNRGRCKAVKAPNSSDDECIIYKPFSSAERYFYAYG